MLSHPAPAHTVQVSPAPAPAHHTIAVTAPAPAHTQTVQERAVNDISRNLEVFVDFTLEDTILNINGYLTLKHS